MHQRSGRSPVLVLWHAERPRKAGSAALPSWTGCASLKAINPDTLNPSGVVVTQVIPKIVADFQQRNSDFLGKARQLTKGFEHVYEGHTFGRPSWLEKEGVVRDTARGCILGYYDPVDQLPDDDLEKPVLRGAAPVSVLEDASRKFGAKKLQNRQAASQTAQRCRCDMCNYGDDVSPQQHPHIFQRLTLCPRSPLPSR